MEFESLQNRFLIAMPNQNESYFDHSVTYICEHNEYGALGIVINRPMQATLADMFEQLETDDGSEVAIDTAITELIKLQPLLTGGPVQPERGFVLHGKRQDLPQPTPGLIPNDDELPKQSAFWDASMPVTEDIALTGSTDVLKAIAAGNGPAEYLVAMGYAGWSAGQLEQELIDNAWLVTRGDSDILFRLPYEQRWTAAAKSLGIDPSMLSADIGHA